MKQIEVPGQGVVEFPDDMSDDEIVSAIKANTPQEPTFGRTLFNEALKGMMNGGVPMALARMTGAGVNKTNELLDDAAYRAGGAVTDFASGAGASPEVAGGLGYATNVGVQAIPSIVAGEVMKPLFSPALKAGGKRLMQSALKPTIQDLRTGKAATAIDTLLEKGINPNEAGVAKLKDQIAKLDLDIKSILAKSPETIKKGDVGAGLLDTYNKFKRQVNPNADIETIKRAWLEFRNHPMLAGKTDIPVALANELKSGTYAQLSKKYGEMGSADVEAQKALARAIREQIAIKVPSVVGPLDEQSKLINAMKVAERRALMEGNRNIGGLALLSPTKTGLLAMLADSYGLSKSYLARLLYSGSEAIPANVGRVGGLLYSTSQNKKER